MELIIHSTAQEAAYVEQKNRTTAAGNRNDQQIADFRFGNKYVYMYEAFTSKCNECSQHLTWTDSMNEKKIN